MRNVPTTGGDDAKATHDAAMFDEVMAGFGLDKVPGGAADQPATIRYTSGPDALPANATADDIRHAEAMGSLPSHPAHFVPAARKAI